MSAASKPPLMIASVGVGEAVEEVEEAVEEAVEEEAVEEAVEDVVGGRVEEVVGGAVEEAVEVAVTVMELVLVGGLKRERTVAPTILVLGIK